MLNRFILLILVLLLYSAVYTQGIDYVEHIETLKGIPICPAEVIVEKGSSECTRVIPGEVFAGKKLELLTRRIGVEEDYNGNLNYFCSCTYQLKPENRELIFCPEDTPEEPTTPKYFFNLLNYAWIEPPINLESEYCDAFRSKYGFIVTGSDFDFFYLLGQNRSFRTLIDDEVAVAMASPYDNTDYWSEGYLYDNYSWSMEVLKNRAVSYKSCEPPLRPDIFLFDLNPLYYNGPYETKEDILNVDDPVSLSGVLTKSLNGTTADGESSILFSINGIAGSEIDIKNLDPKNGMVTFPWGQQAFDFGGSYFYVGIYDPPEVFPEDEEELRSQEGLTFTQVELKFEVTQKDQSLPAEEFKLEVSLIRPPVVLVHGTFDNPTNCWKTGLSPGANGMYQELKRQGFYVTTCDYSGTNGKLNFGFCGHGNEGEGFLGVNYNVNNRVSSFECNKRVVYDNPGGIKDAISYYRDTLGVACTQADAVGHSMGGVLIRVYASEESQGDLPSYDTNYKRPDNFDSGDINRIISMASTHHGSDGAWLVKQFNKGIQNQGKGILELTLPEGIHMSWWLSILALSGAVEDQVPQSTALQRIGPTSVPSHALTFTVDGVEDLKNNVADVDQVYYCGQFILGMYLYFYESVTDQLLSNIALEWDRLPNELREPRDRYYKSYSEQFLDSLVRDIDKFKELYKAPIEKNYDIFYNLSLDCISSGLPRFENRTINILQYETAESSINDFDNDEHINFINHRYDVIQDEYPVETMSRNHEAIDELMNVYRFLIFKNDRNDGTVRYLSQTGSLDELKYVTHFNNHIHSFATRYPESIQRVASLLKGGMDSFDMNGFPNAGQKLPIWLPDMSEIQDPDVTGCEAACWSGMVPDHAMAWARIADSANVIVLNRPVNPDATPLIFENASTKGMNLKGKSSDWGPQKGLITVNQRFSKMWNLYNEPELSKQVEKFDKKVKSLLEDKPEEAVKRQLEKVYSCDFIREDSIFKAWITPQGDNAEDEIRFTGKNNPNQVYTWFNSDNESCPLVPCEANCNTSDLTPFYVLANPNPEIAELNSGVAPVYTADYDLLAIGFFEAAAFQNPEYPYPRPDWDPDELFDCERGVMFDNQIRLLNSLNGSVKELGYKGGNVAHHGPENQFSNMSFTNFPCDSNVTTLDITANPYFDYPITAFEPDAIRGASEGIVRTIQMGPPGYKDINLKRYIAEKRRQGFDIIANPNSPSWEWEYWRPYSYADGFDDRDYPGLPAYPEQLPRLDLQKCIDQYGCLNMQKTKPPNLQITARPNIRFKATDRHAIFPNPVFDQPLSITILSESFHPTVIQIFDQLGRSVRMYKRDLQKGFNQFWIDTQDLPAGQYFVSFNLENEVISESIIIQK